jgi:hypothetical protein
MKIEDSKDEFWKTYEKLPDSLKEALFSEENFNIVSAICEKNGISDENMKSQLVKYVGKVLMGLLPIREFPVMIELDLDLDSEKAREISSEIDMQIFSHLRIDLNKLYMEEHPVAEKKDMSDNKEQKEVVKIKTTEAPKEIEEKKKEPAPIIIPKDDKDTYREPLI